MPRLAVYRWCGFIWSLFGSQLRTNLNSSLLTYLFLLAVFNFIDLGCEKGSKLHPKGGPKTPQSVFMGHAKRLSLLTCALKTEMSVFDSFPISFWGAFRFPNRWTMEFYLDPCLGPQLLLLRGDVGARIRQLLEPKAELCGFVELLVS